MYYCIVLHCIVYHFIALCYIELYISEVMKFNPIMSFKFFLITLMKSNNNSNIFKTGSVENNYAETLYIFKHFFNLRTVAIDVLGWCLLATNTGFLLCFPLSTDHCAF